MNRLFVLREQLHFNSLIAALSANWQAMAAMDKPLGVTVAPYKKKRSHEQNALMWVWLTQISHQAWVAGRQFDEETWNEHAKREFLPERTSKGLEKWRFLPSGERVLAISTPDLNTGEMSLYMNALEAWAVSDLGVEIQ